MSHLQKGDYAPDFILPADDGSQVSLSSLVGSYVVLYFYPKDDTSGCTVEALDFTTLLHEFSSLGASVFGLSPDGIDKHCKFKQKHGLGVTLLADEEKEVLKAYGVWVEKSMYGRKYMGVERSTFLIDSKGQIAEIWRNVKVPDHAKSVLATLAKLKSVGA